MSGTELGRIEIPPGKFGTLTLTAAGDDAESLKKLWAKSEASGEVMAKMHRGGGRGERARCRSRRGVARVLGSLSMSNWVS